MSKFQLYLKKKNSIQSNNVNEWIFLTKFRFKGWGLGLSICKTIFDLMNAEFGVESELEKGSTFWFEIMLKNPSKETILPKLDVCFEKVFLVHSNELYLNYLNDLFSKMKLKTQNSIETMDLKDKNSILLIEESCLKDLAENFIPTEGNAFIIGEIIRKGFQNLNNPLSISHLFNILTFQKDKRKSKPDHIFSSSLRILIVDDNLMILKSLENLLKKLELGNIYTASNGEEAIQIVKSELMFDIIFMDIQMPIKDGITAVKELRELEDSEKSKTPVVALTGNSISNSKLEQCKTWKMEDILMKPINKKDLLSCVRKILNE
jgi:two-component system, NarL family, sensor histidine kinase BarA